MSTWDSYPPTYRSDEVQIILKALKAGECVSVIGLSGAGKSNLIGFLACRVTDGPLFFQVDCNALPAATHPALLAGLIETLGGDPAQPSLRALTSLVADRLKEAPHGICILLDRFDLFNSSDEELRAITGNLRALRDRFKYDLTYVISTRQPLAPSNELAELFCANTLWLGPLSREDALWSIRQYAARRSMNWDVETMEKIIEISTGYPSMLRAVCESRASGTALDIVSMRNSVSVRRRVDEFRADRPSEEALCLSRLVDHPLLCANEPVQTQPVDLTATEQRLLDFFTGHPNQVCAKDALIQAVWPDEKVAAGLRDDSLAQLVHRLRDKLDSAAKKHIQTIPGRGYRYTP